MGRMSNFIMNLHTTVAGKQKIGEAEKSRPKPSEIYTPKKTGGKKGSKKSVSSLLPC